MDVIFLVGIAVLIIANVWILWRVEGTLAPAVTTTAAQVTANTANLPSPTASTTVTA
jgi:hypothetical protein